MIKHAPEVKEYVEKLPQERKEAVEKILEIFRKQLDAGYEETMSYGMPTFVVSKKVYPNGYHCDPKLALPFVSVASQKQFVALYHMGIYAKKELLDWFTAEWPKYSKRKLDMGKSCIRFKKVEEIPYNLLEALAGKMQSDEWISVYEQAFKKQTP